MIEDGNDFELVIFDCDGVLVDSEPLSLSSLQELFKRKDITLSITEIAQQFQGVSLKDTVLFAEKKYEAQFTDDDLDWLHSSLFSKFKEELKPIIGVKNFLDDLKIPCCVASSSARNRIDYSLLLTDLSKYFLNNIFSSTQVKNGKPAPDLFLLAAKNMGVSPNKTLVIEDSPKGIQAAVAAGMKSVGLTAGSHYCDEKDSVLLAQAGANFLANSYEHLALAMYKNLIK